MKFNPTLIALGVLVGAGVIVGAYQLGQQGSSDVVNTQEPAALTQAAQPVAAVSGMASPNAASVDGPRFSHFRVGNRNVKSIFADGRYVWVGTSGGVIRYDTESDDYELFNNKNSGLLSNGIFHVSRLDDRRMAIGTYGGGLAVFDVEANTWQTINIPDGLADQFVYDVLMSLITRMPGRPSRLKILMAVCLIPGFMALRLGLMAMSGLPPREAWPCIKTASGRSGAMMKGWVLIINWLKVPFSSRVTQARHRCIMHVKKTSRACKTLRWPITQIM